MFIYLLLTYSLFDKHMNRNILYDYSQYGGFNLDELTDDYFNASEDERLDLMSHMQTVMQQGGQMSQETGQQGELIQQVQQALKQGAQPQEVISQLLQSQMDPQMVVGIFVQLGLPQQQVVQIVQAVMQQTQSPQEEQTEPEQNPAEEQMEMQTGGYDKQSMLGYSNVKNNPFINNPYNLVKSNKITMANTGKRLLGISNTGDTKIMEPYSGQYEFDGNNVLEIPYGQTNANLQKIDSLKQELVKLNSKKYLDDADKKSLQRIASQLKTLTPKLLKNNVDPATGEVDNSTGYWDRVLNKKRGSEKLDPRAQLALEKAIPFYGADSDGIIDYLSEVTQIPQKELNNLLTGYYEAPSNTINRYRNPGKEISKTQAFLTDVVTDPLIVEEAPEYAGKYILKGGKYVLDKAPVVAKAIGTAAEIAAKAAADAALAAGKQLGAAYNYVKKVAPQAVEFLANNVDKLAYLSRFKTAIFKINNGEVSEQEALKLLNDAKNDVEQKRNINLSKPETFVALSKSTNNNNISSTEGNKPRLNLNSDYSKTTPTTFDNYLNQNNFSNQTNNNSNRFNADNGPIPTVAFLNGFKGNKKPDAKAIIKGKETDLVKQLNGTYSAENGLNYNWDPNSRKFVSTGNTSPQIINTDTPKGTGKNNRFSDAIRKEQEFLKANGFPDIKVDGVLGPKTLAVRNAYHTGVKPVGAKPNNLLPPDIVDDGLLPGNSYDSPNTINISDAYRDEVLKSTNPKNNLVAGADYSNPEELTNPTYGFKTGRLFNNLMNNYKLSKAFEPISLPYMPSVDFKAVDAPFIDPRSYIQNIRDQYGLTTANINSNSTTGQAALANLAAKQSAAEQDVLNQISTRNQGIDYQNRQQRANVYNQIFNQRNAVNSNYTNQLQQTIANSDMIKDNALSNYQTLQNQYTAEDNAYDKTLAFTPHLSDASTIFDKVLGNKKYKYDKIGAQADLEKQNKLLQDAYEAGLKAAKK